VRNLTPACRRIFAAAIVAGASLSIMTTGLASKAAPPLWDDENVSALIASVDGAAEHGLNPSRFDLAPLTAALERNDSAAVGVAAAALYKQLARDLAEGAAAPSDRADWRASTLGLDAVAIGPYLDDALENHQIRRSLEAFAPVNPQYLALKAALAAAGDDEKAVARLRANLERWRWMPRDLGPSYVMVNVPAFELTVVADGAVIARHRVIVGARNKQTPLTTATASAVILNPVWFVPPSIQAEGIGALVRDNPSKAAARGYKAAGEGVIVQAPGPNNELGRMKLVMPNPYSVTLHDTPNKAAFERANRASSHGCIRVDGALDFGAELLRTRPEWNRSVIDDIIKTNKTTQVDLAAPLPVYIVYFTAVADADGAITTYDDIYRRDAAAAAMSDAPADGAAAAKDGDESCG
jgi:murein L,D-transpeptidase YcbB/YkuD